MSTLFVVATPIGNLEDMSPRAIRVLREVTVILAEDTRRTGQLLKRLEIDTPMRSCHRFNERKRSLEIPDLLHSADVALVSDAGTPGVSDPGRVIVNAAVEAGYQVIPIPGASAVSAAVSASGLVEGPFCFAGFLERSGRKRASQIEQIVTSADPVVLFESPHRLARTLDLLAARQGSRRAVVFRELTKLHEETTRGTLSELSRVFADRQVRGEVVVVLGPALETDREDQDPTELLLERLEAGASVNAAAREVASATGLPKSEMYDLARSLLARIDRTGERGGR